LVSKKILITTGTRADFGLLKPLITEIINHKNLELILIVTGTHLSKKHGYTISEIKKSGFKINYQFKNMSKIDSPYNSTKSIGKMIIKFATIFKKFHPDINIVFGDRDEMLASAISASHMNIINVHLMGGDKSGGIDEYNRHAITKLSNIHFTSTLESKKRVIKMGENPRFVFFTGTSAIDDIINKKFTTTIDLEKKIGMHFTGNEILLLQHPVTTQVKESRKQILATMKALVDSKKPVIAIAPNSDVGHQVIFKTLQKFSRKYPQIRLFESFPREDFLGLLNNCRILLGNSSSGMTEAGFFGISVINTGIRQLNREHLGNVINVNPSSSSISNAINQVFTGKAKKSYKNKKLFGSTNSAKLIVKQLIKIDHTKLLEKQITYS